jgi:hypothetical protein
MSIIRLSKPSRRGRYLLIRKRDYSHTDVYSPTRGFLCRLLSMPEGFQVTAASNACKDMEGSCHQTTVVFERAYLRAAA